LLKPLLPKRKRRRLPLRKKRSRLLNPVKRRLRPLLLRLKLVRNLFRKRWLRCSLRLRRKTRTLPLLREKKTRRRRNPFLKRSTAAVR
jgi:hypothetical protein